MVWFLSYNVAHTFYSSICVCVCVCVCERERDRERGVVAVIEQTSELLFYSKLRHDLFPSCSGTRGEIAQLGEHSITIIDVHLLGALSAFRTGRLILRFMHCIVSFAYTLPSPNSPKGLERRERGRGEKGCNSGLSKGIDSLKYGSGKVSETMRGVKILIARLRSI